MVLEFMLGLVYTFGYAGVFLASLIGSASILLPVPSFIFTFLAGKILDPFLVGVFSGIGSAIGELTSYGVGFGVVYGKNKLSKKRKPGSHNRKWSDMAKKWFRGRYGFVLLIVFAATPLPDDVLGLYCGVIRYDIKKYFIAVLIGKIILGIFLAYAGFYGLSFVSHYFF